MISFIIGFLIFLGAYIIVSNWKTKKQITRIKQERAVNGDFKEENANKYVSSILTGVPVKTRYGDGGLTGAGAQETQWCSQILQDMGKKKSMWVNTMGGKQKMTREQVEKHLESI